MREGKDDLAQQRIRREYLIQFVLKPGIVSYSREVTLDPGVRLIDLIRKMLKNLVRQHPELFKGITQENLKTWKFYYGYGEEGVVPEELEPGLSIMELGLFPGSSITMGPGVFFK